MDPKVLVADGEELTELYEDSKITHLTIATVWYVGAIMGGYFGEDRSISYQSDKAHFGLFWAIAQTLLCCLENDSIPSTPSSTRTTCPWPSRRLLNTSRAWGRTWAVWSERSSPASLGGRRQRGGGRGRGRRRLLNRGLG